MIDPDVSKLRDLLTSRERQEKREKFIASKGHVDSFVDAAFILDELVAAHGWTISIVLTREHGFSLVARAPGDAEAPLVAVAGNLVALVNNGVIETRLDARLASAREALRTWALAKSREVTGRAAAAEVSA